ncbi:MAG TPA: DUF4364 family protein [Clostridia bacterium]|jgi:hypothetical protein|nr:DUF4364 family protein [Clostridia bacterium]
MSYFSDGFTKNKLIVLYVLREHGLELTREQFTTLAGESELMPFFELQAAVSELEEEGLIAAVPRVFGQAYTLTAMGRETIDMFAERLPLSLREELQEYVELSGGKLHRSAQYSSGTEKLPSGVYRVTLKALESDNELISLSLLMPDAQSARLACKNWENSAGEIYRFLFDRLLNEAKDAD